MSSHDPLQALNQLNATYASVVDAGDWNTWCDLFTDDCVYRVVPRENFERNMPLATMAFTSKGMLKDRAYAVKHTLFHDPYYQRHVLGPTRILSSSADKTECETAYAVFRTKPSQLTTVFNVGRYLDTVVVTDSGLKFAQKLVIYDSELIPNSIIYPL